MQDSGLITCAKHYILFEQVEVCRGEPQGGSRTDCQYYSAEADGKYFRALLYVYLCSADKTLRELYLPSFAETVRQGTGSIMWYASHTHVS